MDLDLGVLVQLVQWRYDTPLRRYARFINIDTPGYSISWISKDAC
jgi:hypothetical protein